MKIWEAYVELHADCVETDRQHFGPVIATSGETSTSKTRDKSRTIPLRPTGQSLFPANASV